MTMNDRAHWREDEWSVAERATYTLGRMIERGTTRVRSYAQIDADCGLERFEGVLAAKEAHAGRCEVEIMAFPQAGLLKEKGVPELMDRALSSGAAVVGGIDPCTLDRDPVRHLDIIFDRGHIPLRAGEGGAERSSRRNGAAGRLVHALEDQLVDQLAVQRQVERLRTRTSRPKGVSTGPGSLSMPFALPTFRVRAM